jgi:hypothetical protein
MCMCMCPQRVCMCLCVCCASFSKRSGPVGSSSTGSPCKSVYVCIVCICIHTCVRFINIFGTRGKCDSTGSPRECVYVLCVCMQYTQIIYTWDPWEVTQRVHPERICMHAFVCVRVCSHMYIYICVRFSKYGRGPWEV